MYSPYVLLFTEPLYYWQQTEDDLTIIFRLHENFTKEDIHVSFSPNQLSVALKDPQFPILKGDLFSLIDHESSTWIIKENRYLF